MPAVQRPGRFLAVLAGLLLALAASVSPARADAPTTGEIEGWVRDQGRPVAGITVDIPNGYSPPLAPAVLTDATGHFRMTKVPVGSFTVRFTPPGGGLVQLYPDTTDISAAVGVPVRAGRTTTITEHVLPHGGVFGRILSNAGAPVAGARVGIEAGRTVIETTTDADGDYELGYLAAGSYVVYVWRATSAPKQWWPRAEVVADAQPVTVAVGSRVRVDERLFPLGSITGSYTTRDGRPIVAMVEADGNRDLGARTSATDGSFTLWLAPGDYTVYFDAESDNRDQWATGTLDEAAAEVFTVREDGVVHLDEHPVEGGAVGGRVVEYAGAPFAEAPTVTLYDADDEAVATVTADSDGNWSMADVFPGTYTVYYFHDGQAEWANGKYDADSADPVTVTTGSTTTLSQTFRPNTTLVVFATVDGGEATTFCAAVDAAGPEPYCTEDGTVFFDHLPPGSYAVTVTVAGHAPVVATGTITSNNHTDTVTVPVI